MRNNDDLLFYVAPWLLRWRRSVLVQQKGESTAKGLTPQQQQQHQQQEQQKQQPQQLLLPEARVILLVLSWDLWKEWNMDLTQLPPCQPYPPRKHRCKMRTDRARHPRARPRLLSRSGSLRGPERAARASPCGRACSGRSSNIWAGCRGVRGKAP
eukprot:TRINITY_DN3986_c1_g1_i1.p3 TRINITY_DN3986_c1_g1~~TRINITY_DN3986_c1_g1_i1.p3  ORF type:complete len:155 (+),score=24.59 TRINITY_DN3986_c1_g1_i1:279-743(+)